MKPEEIREINIQEARELINNTADIPEIFLSGREYFVNSRGRHVPMYDVLMKV